MNLIQLQETGEQQRSELRNRRSKRQSLLAENIPKFRRISPVAKARLRESEARNALLHIRAVLTRAAHTRKVSLDIREKHGDTRITEGLCHHL